jgi:3-phenylpropionate/cinnamic acid dioxygenase small subunit
VPDRLAAVARIEEIGEPMPVTEKAVLTAELRLDIQEFYSRYAECLDNGRLQQWPEFFLDSCTYCITTRHNLRLGPEEHLVSLSTRTTLRDRIVAIGQSEDYEPHAQRHLITNFRVQAASGEELRVLANFQILRTFPEKRTEHFVSGLYDDRVAIAGSRLNFREKLCVLDSDVPPESLLYPI